MEKSYLACLVNHGPEGCPGYPHPKGETPVTATVPTQGYRWGRCWTCFGPATDGSTRELCGYHQDEVKEIGRRRERIATALHAAILASPSLQSSTITVRGQVVKTVGSPERAYLACCEADALIAELDKP
jgi:hypothetical protein